MKKALGIIFLSYLLAACDPAMQLEFINQSESDLTVKLNVDTTVFDLETYGVLPDQIQGDSIIFQLKPAQSQVLYFGMGTWSDEEINRLVTFINRIELETQAYKIVYKTPKKLTQLFSDRRVGRSGWQSRIVLESE